MSGLLYNVNELIKNGYIVHEDAVPFASGDYLPADGIQIEYDGEVITMFEIANEDIEAYYNNGSSIYCKENMDMFEVYAVTKERL